MKLCGAASDWKKISHSTKGVFCRGKQFLNIKQTSRFDGESAQCLFHHDAWNPMGTMLPEPDARCSVHFAGKGGQCPSKLISPHLAWRLGRKQGKENLHELEESWRVWPGSLATKQLKDFFTFFATCKVLAFRMEDDGSSQHHVQKAPCFLRR